MSATTSSRPNRTIRVTPLIDPVRGCLYAIDLFEKDLYQKHLKEVRQGEEIPVTAFLRRAAGSQPASDR